MTALRNIAVIHFSDSEIEQAQKIQQRIRKALIRGRHVVMVCDAPMIGRMERLTFACVNVRELPGRFAIVVPDSESFSETIPSTLCDRMQLFETEKAACDWLEPNPVDENGTLMELSGG